VINEPIKPNPTPASYPNAERLQQVPTDAPGDNPATRPWFSGIKSLRHNLLVVAVLVLAILAAAVLWGLKQIEPGLRDRLVTSIGNQYGCDVDLQNLRLSPFTLSATGGRLVLWEKGFQDFPPLATVDSFTARISPLWLLLAKLRFSQVTLDHLKVNVPPRKERTSNSNNKNPIAPSNQRQDQAHPQPVSPVTGIVVEQIIADGAELSILPRDERKEPLFFGIRTLHLYSADRTGMMRFNTVLTNAEPPGVIDSDGAFGPWNRDDPSMIPVSGNYTFKGADLSGFRGISGKLTSVGKYQGVLGNIEVDGNTDTPDFAVKTSNQPVLLKTQFHAIVDGTSGDTYLQPVNAQLGRSSLVARGGIYGQPGVSGKTLSLEVTANNSRIADMLRLAIKGEPLMTGAVAYKVKLEVPPGHQDITEKLYLNGSFSVGAGKFTESDIQNKINNLSNRAQGDAANDQSGPNAVSNLGGSFVLKDGLIHFSNLEFKVPGATVKLNGSYALVSRQVDFSGTVATEAKVSQMTTGVKSFFLKMVDPLFKKHHAGAVIPIHITGTSDDPRFGLDVGRVIKGK